MSASLEQLDYLETAYRSDKPIAERAVYPMGLWEGLMRQGTPLPLTQPSEKVSTTAIADMTPSEYRKVNQDPKNKHNDFFWTETKLSQEKLSGWTSIYLNLSGLAKIMCLFLLPFSYVVIFFLAFSSQYFSFSDLIDFYLILTFYFLLPCSVIWGQFELMNRGYFTLWFLKAKKHYELNRKTGMVTLYKGNGKPRFSHPFHEFDCILTSSPTPQGLMNYGLFLVHRYNGYSFGVPLQSLMPGSPLVAEYHYLWNMIQAYMDVTSPMPDILVLEEARERDPTTREFDAKGLRGTALNMSGETAANKGDLLKNPRGSHFWRNMSDEDFEQILKTIAKSQ
ncbi:hypothetical protein [uncultured Shewanella sp.]|uniref:hypothetical protein n=1 Tax=uncultured Shewanella sp. TaxID=173975 RepID=UPI00262EAF5C|nr:hypothetical protein [uncultured Shewanella sp.]